MILWEGIKTWSPPFSNVWQTFQRVWLVKIVFLGRWTLAWQYLIPAHSSSSAEGPEQYAPPLLGRGLSHFLLLFFLPVTESQEPHSLQSDQAPSTARNYNLMLCAGERSWETFKIPNKIFSHSVPNLLNEHVCCLFILLGFFFLESPSMLSWVKQAQLRLCKLGPGTVF